MNWFIEMKYYNRTMVTQYNPYDRWEVKMYGNGITFKGTEEELDKLLDKLYSNESNHKVIGVHRI